jgi:GTP cyclohydrolase III
MTPMLRFPITTIALSALLSTAALAQTPNAAKPTLRDRIAAMKAHVAAKTPPAASKMAAVAAQKAGSAQAQQPRTAKSLACSKSADRNGLHGKPRRSFMEKCKRA